MKKLIALSITLLTLPLTASHVKPGNVISDNQALIDATSRPQVDTPNIEVLVRALLQSGANTDAYDEAGWSPLHLATAAGKDAVVKVLLDHRFPVDITTREHIQVTPLALAAMHGHTSTAKLLLEHGANPNMQDRTGCSPAHTAVVYRQLPLLKLLVRYGADLSLNLYLGNASILVLACDPNSKSEISYDIIEYLLDRQAPYPGGCEALAAQREQRQPELATFLRKYKQRVLCSACDQVLEKKNICTGCRKVWYCNQKCQQHHWPLHKKLCKLSKDTQ